MSWFEFGSCRHIYAHWIYARYGEKNLYRQCVRRKCLHIETRPYDENRDNKFEPFKGHIVKTRQENLDALELKEYPE